MKSKIEKATTLIMPITGGIGRNIFATAVIRNLKKAYPNKKIYVIAGFPEVFQGNPNCRPFGFSNCNHLYEDVISNNPEALLLEVEPYRHPEYVSGNMHIVNAWCDLLGIECESILPDLYLTSTEKNMAEAYIEELKVKYKKPIVIIQHSGGKMPEFNSKQENLQNLAVMHRRSLHEKTTQAIVDQLGKDGYMVLSIQSKKQFAPNGAEIVETNIRKLAALATHAVGVIAIDSFYMHACAALGVKALVAWMGTSPDRLGYDMHKNLRRLKSCVTPECHRPNSYAFDYQPNGAIWDCPFSDACRDYTAQEIIDAYKEMKGEDYINVAKNFKVEEKPQVIETCANNSCK
jgi:hypothetical protein